MRPLNVTAWAMIGVVVVVGHQLRTPSPGPTIVILPNGAGEVPQGRIGGDWRRDVLSGLGNTAPTQDTLWVLDAWHEAEGGTALFNPLNTTWEMPGATCYNAHPCVKNYDSYEQGIDATLKTLQSGHPGYDVIVRGLVQGDAQMVIDGIAQSPWGTNAGAVTRIYRRLRSDDVRARILARALSQVGKRYIMGTAGPDTFDCSGLVQWVYAQEGVTTGRVTQDQLAQLQPIEASQVQPGDMVYFQFSWDQHTGILDDVDGDGRWDMINAGTPEIGVVVTNDVFSDPFWTDHIIGYRSAV